MKNIIFFMMTLFTCQALGQVNLTGKVVGADGVPLNDVTVQESLSQTLTKTDGNGEFTIAVPELPARLLFSIVGFDDQTLEVNNQSSINVVMYPSNESLDEVVVVGYGTQKKVNLTGAVSAVKGEELVKRPVASTTLALQGMVPGVTITSNSGTPGAEGESIRIRGIGTLNNNDPLVLIDGVASTLNAVNPNDIENISVLKDAASAAIYGSRASNGVILVTTKRAKGQELSINWNGNIGLQKLTDRPKMLGAIDYLELYDLAVSNDSRNVNTGTPGGRTYGEEYINNYRSMMGIDPYIYPNTDWGDVVFDDVAVQNLQNVSVSGGTEKLSALASINLQDQNGIYPGTNLKRYTVRMNTDYKFSDKVNVGLDLSGRQSTTTQPAGMAIASTFRTPPIYAYKTPNGNPAYNPLNSNPWATSQWDGDKGYSNTAYQEVFVNAKLGYAPFDFLSFDFSYVPRYNFSTTKAFTNTIDYYNMDEELVNTAPQMRSISMSRPFSFNQDLQFLANYHESFGGHNLQSVVGFQQITNHSDNLSASRQNSEFQYDELSAFPQLNQTGNGSASEWALQSWFGRVNYDYQGKYLLEANLRYDGSSRFFTGYKWGAFPSVSGGWRFSEEQFMKELHWLSNAKVRGSWGQLGNQEGIGNYAFSMDINLNLPMVFNGQVVNGYGATNYAMRDISWETTTMTNLGLDLGFFRNKLEVVFDYYIKNTDGILLNLDIPSVLGYSNKPRQNAGKVENKGWDLSVVYANHKNDFSYRFAATLSDVRNEIIDMKGIVDNNNGILTNRAGYPIGSLYGLEYDGMFSSFDDAQQYAITQFGNLQGGDLKYKDQLTVDTDGDGIPDAGDGLINEFDYVVMGNTIPRYTYSFDASFQYKNFDLGLFFQGVGKRDGYLSYDQAWAFNNGASVQQWQKDGMWTEGQTDAKYPRMFVSSSNNTQPSTYWKQNAAYLRLKNVQFGYTFSDKLLKDFFIKGARVYVSGQNLFTMKSMRPGYDPEMIVTAASASAQGGRLPLTSVYSFGFNLNF